MLLILTPDGPSDGPRKPVGKVENPLETLENPFENSSSTMKVALLLAFLASSHASTPSWYTPGGTMTWTNAQNVHNAYCTSGTCSQETAEAGAMSNMSLTLQVPIDPPFTDYDDTKVIMLPLVISASRISNTCCA